MGLHIVKLPGAVAQSYFILWKLEKFRYLNTEFFFRIEIIIAMFHQVMKNISFMFLKTLMNKKQQLILVYPRVLMFVFFYSVNSNWNCATKRNCTKN